MAHLESEIRSLVVHEKNRASCLESDMVSIRLEMMALRKKIIEKKDTQPKLHEMASKLQKRVLDEQTKLAMFQPGHQVQSLLSQLRHNIEHNPNMDCFIVEDEIDQINRRYGAVRTELYNISEQVGLILTNFSKK